MKFMEWNIHGMGGYGKYEIPVNMIINTIVDINPDVFVLLEFIECANGFCDLQNAFSKLHYSMFLTKIKKGANGVLIAVRDTIIAEKVIEKSEYLEIKIKYNDNDWMNVVGMRILTQGNYKNFAKRRELFVQRLNHLKEQNNNFIMLFDANNGAIQFESNKEFEYQGVRKNYSYQYIWRTVENQYKWSLITPDQGGPYSIIDGGKYSAVTGENKPENYHTKEDHIITSFEKAKFKNVDYYWDFVNKRNGYGNRTRSDVLSDLIGLPDHAVLVAEFNI